ncbi:MAG TPA: helicase-related protein [Pirellulales bacterium]|jgi:hypothetical protein|nr:helicase-related protein [Pirellulales bacterium]
MRDRIVEFLRKELIGPDPIDGCRQQNGEEILIAEPPRNRYGAGVLFPQAAKIEQAAEAVTQAETLGTVVDPVNEETEEQLEELSSEAGTTDDLDLSEISEDPADASDYTTSLINAYLPSALGFSCFVLLPSEGLAADIQAATYTTAKRTYQTRSGESKEGVQYERTPLAIPPLLIASSELRGTGTVIVRRDVVDKVGKPTGLQICLVSRPVADADLPDQRLLTASLVNTLESGGRPENEKCFFQVGLRIRDSNGTACFLEYPERQGEPLHDDDASMNLLYSQEKTFAIGHGCSAEWEGDGEAITAIRSEVMPAYELKPIIPAALPGLELRMLDLADVQNPDHLFIVLDELGDRYEAWITGQQNRLDDNGFPESYRPAGERHLNNCRTCLARFRAGTQLLRDDNTVSLAFRLANRAMLEQQLHYQLASEKKRSWRAAGPTNNPVAEIDAPVWPDYKNPQGGKGAWRPFQLAFIVMNLRSLAIPDDEERSIVDLIWFPTGGGKTEAYLGLTAFTIFLRRLREPANAGTTVLMRYTLRLLTTQQFQRAASLICACERIRRERSDLGNQPISIGLWVGNSVTPGDRTDAIRKLNAMGREASRENPFIVLNCPWCGAEMGPTELGKITRVMGYQHRQAPAPQTVVFRCPDVSHDCPFSGTSGLPLCVIDEDLYRTPPTLLVGTVDKFAMLPWRPEARTLFGIGIGSTAPPELIIQDELHLISGPLGSMVGQYETIIQELCSKEINGQYIRPKIIASTATICRAAEQCHALYNCGSDRVFLFPPQALRGGDSFFALEDQAADGRLYVGVHASALPSHTTAQVRTLSALLQGPPSSSRIAAERDPYWTLISYFNSLRELGQAATLIRADIREHLNAMWQRKGIQKQTDHDPRRFINSALELTSRMPSTEIPESLGRLFQPYDPGRDERPVDICLATNMISVGVDVPRLGLMAVIGQPKTTSEYIQATSRVGRSARGPGLVVTIFNPAKPRDRSHYERFRSYHAAIYRWVEPTSVTPFAAPVRSRALHALVVTLVRYLGTEANRGSPNPFPDQELIEHIKEIILRRVRGVDKEEEKLTMQLLDDRLRRWQGILPSNYGTFGPPPIPIPLMYPAGSEPQPSWGNAALSTPTSMRNVDATCSAMMCRDYPNTDTDQENQQ